MEEQEKVETITVEDLQAAIEESSSWKNKLKGLIPVAAGVTTGLLAGVVVILAAGAISSHQAIENATDEESIDEDQTDKDSTSDITDED